MVDELANNPNKKHERSDDLAHLYKPDHPQYCTTKVTQVFTTMLWMGSGEHQKCQANHSLCAQSKQPA